MKFTTSNFRNIFTILGVLVLGLFAIANSLQGLNLQILLTTLAVGLGFLLVLSQTDKFLKSSDARTIVVSSVGLFAGCLLGSVLLYPSTLVLEFFRLDPQNSWVQISQFLIYAFSIYFAITASEKASESFNAKAISEEETRSATPSRMILLDQTVLSDPRFVEVASSGLLDKQLFLPSYIYNQIQAQSENADENVRNRAKKALDTIRKLELMGHLQLNTLECEEPSDEHQFDKLLTVAKAHKADIFTADSSQNQKCKGETRIINLQVISNALKPLTQTGEYINIKIQRYGKEALQGVGYLDDGTMVVVNGGASFIGENVKARVLSIKHTTSGRMIFCNALEDHLSMDDVQEDQEEENVTMGSSAKRYFSV